MFEFDSGQMSFELVELQSVTIASGGSIRVIDKQLSTPQKVAYKRIKVPMSVARGFIERNAKISNYLRPVLTCVVRYMDCVVMLERHPLGSLGQLDGDGVFGQTQWIPSCQANYQHIVCRQLLNTSSQWYFDGRYIYNFNHELTSDIIRRNTISLSDDQSFRQIDVNSIDIQKLSNVDKLTIEPRQCVAFLSSTDQFAISPPLFKKLSDIQVFVQPDGAGQPQPINIDIVDTQYFVNLQFVLYASQIISRVINFDAIEPLQLPRLMLELSTVNLPNVPKHIKCTYDTGNPFSHYLAWSLGRLNQTTNINDYVAVRQLLKYLMTKSLFRRSMLTSTLCLKPDVKFSDVAPVNIAQQVDDTNWMSIHNLIDSAKRTPQLHDSFDMELD